MEKNFEIGIYDYDTDYHFLEEEEFLLNVVNREFGYEYLYTLVTLIDVDDDPTIEDINEKRKNSISRVIKKYGKNDFNNDTYVNKNDFTNDLMERMESMENIDGQYIYDVCDFNGKVVIY